MAVDKLTLSELISAITDIEAELSQAVAFMKGISNVSIKGDIDSTYLVPYKLYEQGVRQVEGMYARAEDVVDAVGNRLEACADYEYAPVVRLNAETGQRWSTWTNTGTTVEPTFEVFTSPLPVKFESVFSSGDRIWIEGFDEEYVGLGRHLWKVESFPTEDKMELVSTFEGFFDSAAASLIPPGETKVVGAPTFTLRR